MSLISYEKLNSDNFNIHSLDGFIHRHEVTEGWLKKDGKYILCETHYIDDWNASELIEEAKELIALTERGGAVILALEDGKTVGFSSLSEYRLGSGKQYIELLQMQVSLPYRNKHIGRKLFQLTAEEAGKRGAKKLYISANSSKQTQCFYRNVGCVQAVEISKEAAEKEPFDIQMEYSI